MNDTKDDDDFPVDGVDVNLNVLRGDYNALKMLYGSLDQPNLALDKVLQAIEYEWENN